MGPCEVCNGERGSSVGVASVPGAPLSVAWCRPCLGSGAIPLWVAVVETALSVPSPEESAGWREHVAPWWMETVEQTLGWVQVSEDEFIRRVRMTAEDFTHMEERDGS